MTPDPRLIEREISRMREKESRPRTSGIRTSLFTLLILRDVPGAGSGAPGAPDVEIGCTRGGCLVRGEQKDGYRFPSDGELLVEAVDAPVRDPLFLEAAVREALGDARGPTLRAPGGLP